MPLRLALRRLFSRSHVAGIMPLLRDPKRLKTVFETEFASFIERRSAWVRRYPEYVSAKTESLDNLLVACRHALILSPHPDDELIGCGGAILELVKAGASVTIVQLTDGSDTLALRGASEKTRRTARLREAESVAKFMGVKDLRLWALPDGAFEIDVDLIGRMRDLILELNPDLIFLPFINDPQPDHIKTNRLLSESLRRMELDFQCQVVSYETWAFVPASHYLNTTDFFERKAEALALYPIPMKVVDYIALCAKREAWHHYEMSSEFGFAENYLVQESPDYLKMTTRIFRTST